MFKDGAYSWTDKDGRKNNQDAAEARVGYYAQMADEAGAAHMIARSILETYDYAATAAGPDAHVPALVSLLSGRPV